LATDLKLPEDSRALTVRFFYEAGYKHKIRKKGLVERLPKVLTRTAWSMRGLAPLVFNNSSRSEHY
jgi:hypothetical protein